MRATWCVCVCARVNSIFRRNFSIAFSEILQIHRECLGSVQVVALRCVHTRAHASSGGALIIMCTHILAAIPKREKHTTYAVEAEMRDLFQQRFVRVRVYVICRWLMVAIDTVTSTVYFFTSFCVPHISFVAFVVGSCLVHAFFFSSAQCHVFSQTVRVFVSHTRQCVVC